MDLEDFCKKLPKLELHAHLNGSVSPKTIRKLCELKNKNFNEELSRIDTSMSLKECFKIFDIVHTLTDTTDALFITTCDVISEFHNDNVIYLEIRSTPKYVEGKMNKNEYIETIIKAIEHSKKLLPEIIVKFLVSVNRRNGFEDAEENVKLAIDYYKKYPEYVVGIDLSGDPTEGDAYLNLFKNARNIGLKIAAHCAEVPNEKEIMDILEFKPDRLGHCTNIHPNLKGSHKLFGKLIESKIPVELCLTSNLKCETIKSLSEHQFLYLYEANHPICLATDDKGVFDTTLSQEYKLAADYYNLTKDNLKQLVISSVDYAFVSKEEKIKLLNTIAGKNKQLN
ncbi:adenosine deaminase-like protein [Microplitis demolitor]|uniref:adenosine deaminase-like protein n=1 Tax=Microplitis demolitor TaxID=69319 RepID=UPI0004400293|nr:adenosine deaminase-like protein [Microplitis demolitor]